MARSPRPPELRLPRPPRWSRLAALLSIALHALLLIFGWVEGRLLLVQRPAERLVYLPPAEGPVAIPLPPLAPTTGRGAARHGGVPLERRPPRSGRIAQLTPTAPAPTVRVGPPPPLPPPADTAADSSHGAVPNGRLTGPALDRGRLWVNPLPLPPRELAQRLTRKSHAELADSAVAVTVQAFLDSIAKEPGADRVALPSWTTKVAGKTFGLDGRNIYIAGLRIPAVILGLLPLSGGGNIDQNRAYAHVQDLRADLMRAAQRSATVDEFKHAVRELRKEKERQRTIERNQRLPSDSIMRSDSVP